MPPTRARWPVPDKPNPLFPLNYGRSLAEYQRHLEQLHAPKDPTPAASHGAQSSETLSTQSRPATLKTANRDITARVALSPDSKEAARKLKAAVAEQTRRAGIDAALGSLKLVLGIAKNTPKHKLVMLAALEMSRQLGTNYREFVAATENVNPAKSKEALSEELRRKKFNFHVTQLRDMLALKKSTPASNVIVKATEKLNNR